MTDLSHGKQNSRQLTINNTTMDPSKTTHHQQHYKGSLQHHSPSTTLHWIRPRPLTINNTTMGPSKTTHHQQHYNGSLQDHSPSSTLQWIPPRPLTIINTTMDPSKTPHHQQHYNGSLQDHSPHQHHNGSLQDHSPSTTPQGFPPRPLTINNTTMNPSKTTHHQQHYNGFLQDHSPSTTLQWIPQDHSPSSTLQWIQIKTKPGRSYMPDTLGCYLNSIWPQRSNVPTHRLSDILWRLAPATRDLWRVRSVRNS